jgi:ERCC4-type nuclease
MATAPTRIVIDVRERALIAELTELGVTHDTAQLVLGDILIECSGSRTLVFERKTMADLAASIKDGRLREQKARLLASYPRQDVFYLIEGDRGLWPGKPGAVHGGLPETSLETALLNLSLRDGLSVLRDKGVKATALLLADVLKRIKDSPGSYLRSQTSGVAGTGGNATAPVKKNAALVNEPLALLVAQVSAMPGVSAALARKLVQHLGLDAHTMDAFLRTLKELPHDRRLSSIDGVGKKLEEAVWRGLSSCVPPAPPPTIRKSKSRGTSKCKAGTVLNNTGDSEEHTTDYTISQALPNTS